MKRLFIVPIMVSILAACSNPSPAPESGATEKIDSTQLIARGKYLVDMSGCNDCHSPKIMTPQGPVPDPSRLLSGYREGVPLPPYDTATANKWMLFHPEGTASRGPWGISFAGNLTPDLTGIGAWTEQQFSNAIRKGFYKGIEGSRMLNPPMPWPTYSRMSDEDLSAIFAYLKSLPPIRNIVPAALPPGS